MKHAIQRRNGGFTPAETKNPFFPSLLEVMLASRQFRLRDTISAWVRANAISRAQAPAPSGLVQTESEQGGVRPAARSGLSVPWPAYRTAYHIPGTELRTIFAPAEKKWDAQVPENRTHPGASGAETGCPLAQLHPFRGSTLRFSGT